MTPPVPITRRSVLLAALAAGLLGGLPTLSGCAGPRLDLATAAVDRRPPGSTIDPTVSVALSDFSGVVLDRLASDQNLICSPLSIWVALAMTRNGARGTTATEMDLALQYPALAVLNDGLNTLTQLLTTRSGRIEVGDAKGEISLDLANQVFGEQSITWLEDFLAVLGEFYGTGVAKADFVGDPQRERKMINDWVAEVTHDKIVDLVPADLITPSTRLVLVNAIHFAAPWAPAFTDPVTGEFDPGTGRVPTEMITTTYDGRAARGDGWQAVEIPYLGGNLAMTMILPDVGADERVQTELSRGLITDVLAALTPGQAVTVTMPTFGFRTEVALRATLEALGMRAAFADADFSGMTADADLAILDVVHQGWIAVDQHGTEAAAATAVVMLESSGGLADHTITVVLDRPFWFIIHDVPTAAPLLVGRVADPANGDH